MAAVWARAATGFGAAAGVSAIARLGQALSPRGAVAATAVGGLTVTGAGFWGGTALATFFVSSSLLGHLPAWRRLEQQRGNERDAIQVLANGGVASVLALLSVLPAPSLRSSLLLGFGGAVAAATADTWATEIGSRSRQRPRSAGTLRPVPEGASGGVTWAGLAAAAAGAATIGAVLSAGSLWRHGTTRDRAIAVTLGGFAGAFIDSVLGATVQEVRFCDVCREETERLLHRCGAATRPIRGAPWCTNDTVNALATVTGAAAAMAVSTHMDHRRRSRWRHCRVPFPRRITLARCARETATWLGATPLTAGSSIARPATRRPAGRL
ncbi:MAG: DUF92 domain-containing protein [Chloroflexia bacterium]|nr:DUF92 domain-containing protein [Chloroflexia bacterium]